jgi:hypothetical protein
MKLSWRRYTIQHRRLLSVRLPSASTVGVLSGFEAYYRALVVGTRGQKEGEALTNRIELLFRTFEHILRKYVMQICMQASRVDTTTRLAFSYLTQRYQARRIWGDLGPT